MNLEGLINISGKNGLFKVISNSKNMIIVESLILTEITLRIINHTLVINSLI